MRLTAYDVLNISCRIDRVMHYIEDLSDDRELEAEQRRILEQVHEGLLEWRSIIDSLHSKLLRAVEERAKGDGR